MTGRIPWSTYSGEEIETVIATYICLENPRAERIRPSQGDRGIDLVVRNHEAVTVYQIKKFSDNLTASQKSKIIDSWETLQDFVSSKKLKLSEWHLVMPLDPTPENLEWFTKLGLESGVEVLWEGLTKVDAWTAKMPYVADYFFADGKAAEREELARLFEIAHLKDPSTPEELMSQLTSLQDRMDKINPYYSYSISVKSSFESVPVIPPPRPGLVMAAMEETADGGAIVVEVFQKFDAASELCPITFNVSPVAGNEASRSALENLLDYGDPVRNVPMVLTGPSLDMPLPFSAQAAMSVMTTFPIERETHASFALSWNDVLFISLEKRYAHSGDHGFKWGGKDRSGLLEIELIQDSRKGSGMLKFNVSLEKLVDGWNPRELKRTLDFMRVAINGNVDFVINGSKQFMLPFSDLGISSDYIEAMSSFVDDMLVILESATEDFKLPSASAIVKEKAVTLRRESMFLRAGCNVQNWDDLSLEITNPDGPILVPSGPTLAKVITPFKVDFPERPVRCGLIESLFVGMLSLSSDGKRILAKPHPDYGGKLIRIAHRPDTESSTIMNQMLVAPAPSPEEWLAQVESADNHFKNVNGVTDRTEHNL